MGCTPGDEECQKKPHFTVCVKSSGNTTRCRSNETPRHKVCLSPFKIMKYEITQGEYEKVMGYNPSRFKKCGSRCPVDNINWYDAKKFCERIGGRLCTEAEWEYAAKAGTNHKYYGYSVDEVAWYDGNSDYTTHPVGKKKPNAWGLYDMLGNVFEWVADKYVEDYYSDSPQQDPKGPSSGIGRVLRGGGFSYGAGVVRVSFRAGWDPADRTGVGGSRCCFDVK